MILGGCGSLPPDPQASGAIVVFAAFEGPEQDAPTIRSTALVVVGGVRGFFNGPSEQELILKNIPFGDEDPSRQPMTVTAPGYRTESQQLTLRKDMATFVDLTMEKVDLTQTGTVAGAVQGSGGEPIVNALVTFTWNDAGTPSTLEGFTDNRGDFIIGGIPVGPATVEAVAAGYLPEDQQTVVEPDEGGTNADLSFSLLSGQTTVVVQGVVQDLRTEAPLAGAEVTIADRPAALTGQDGRFEVPEVLVGEQPITAKLAGYDDYEDTINVMPGMGDVVVVVSRVSSEPPGVPYTVAGTVTLIGNPDNAGATVTAFDKDRGINMATATTDTQGRYYLFLPAGCYEIAVTFGEKSISREVDYSGGGRIVDGIDFTLTVGA